MGLKSATLQRSAERVHEEKASVLEHDANDVSSSGSRNGSEKPQQMPRGNVDPIPSTPESAADEVEALYLEHRNLLLFVACRKFRVPEYDAENLIQEVFLSFLQASVKIENIRAWLVAAMCNASRHYLRTQGRVEPLPENFNDHGDPDSHGLADQFAMRMTVHKALGYMQGKCRETLWLHYFEGRSAGDMALEMQTTNRYAEKLIHNCLKRVREIYKSITTVTR